MCLQVLCWRARFYEHRVIFTVDGLITTGFGQFLQKELQELPDKEWPCNPNTHPQELFIIQFFLMGIVLSWWCLVVLDYTCIMLDCTLLNISPKCYFVPYSNLAEMD